MNSNEPYAFIFDMDGVLVDNMQMHARSWVELFRDYGLEGLDPDRYLRETAGMKGLDVLRHFLDKNITPQKAETLTELKDFLYRFMYRSEIRPIGGLERFLDKAAAMGIRLGVGTGATARNIEYTLGIPGLRDRFQAVVGSHQVKEGKPHPDIFLRVAELLETDPERCIVFEDALPGLEAARAAGMKSIALATTNPAEIMNNLPGVITVTDDFTPLHPEEILENAFMAQPSAT